MRRKRRPANKQPSTMKRTLRIAGNGAIALFYPIFSFVLMFVLMWSEPVADRFAMGVAVAAIGAAVSAFFLWWESDDRIEELLKRLHRTERRLRRAEGRLGGSDDGNGEPTPRKIKDSLPFAERS